ncbi:MAG: ferritin-like fold-containing protein [Dermatophilaceae bacterium]
MPDAASSSATPAVVDLLGVLAYGQLSAFTRVAADSGLAPLQARRLVARTAVDFYRHFEQLAERLDGLGVGVEEAMAPFVEVIDEYHERTHPTDWLEGLVKAYVGDGIARDFYREMAAYIDDDTRAFVLGILQDHGQAAFIVAEVRAAIAADPRVGGRLSLWGRRLVGEAIQRAQRVGGERDALTELLVGGGAGAADVVEMGHMFERLTAAHTARMERMGLSA